jgi:hypothetical protein
VIREHDGALDLHALAREVQRLVPSWSDPGKFYDRRDQLAHDLRRLARHGSPEAPGRPTEEERRLAKLLLLKNDELARVRRQLVEAARARPRRRQVSDARQLRLF